MPMTEEHRKNREGTLGSTEVAAIMGLSKYRTPHDIYLFKTGRAEPKDISDKPEVDFGNRAETMILDWAEEDLGQKIYRNRYLSSLSLRMSCQLDGQLESGVSVDAKSSGFGSIRVLENWGDPGTDQVPDDVLIQAHGQMILTEKALCYIIALLGGNRWFQLFRIVENPKISDQIKNEVGNFWTEYILADTPPPDSQPSPEVVKRLRREPGETITLGPEAITAYDALQCAKETAKEATAQAEALKSEFLMMLGSAEVGEFPDGTSATYFEQTRRGLDQKLLLADMPDARERYPKISTFRVLRKRKG